MRFNQLQFIKFVQQSVLVNSYSRLPARFDESLATAVGRVWGSISPPIPGQPFLDRPSGSQLDNGVLYCAENEGETVE